MRPTADNSGHTAKHRSAQIAKATSYVRKTLSERKQKEKEIEEMRKLGESAGIEDLMAVYGEYQRLMQIATHYLKETGPRFTFSITDSTS